VAAWVAAQSEHARHYLDALPGRLAIEAALEQLAGLPVQSAARRFGRRWFRYANDGAAEQASYLVSDSAEDPGRALIDPNPLTAGASTSIAATAPSPDGELVAYSWSEAGSDWLTWRVRETETGLDRLDTVPWAKFSDAAWLPDGSGFLYGGFAPPAPGAGELVDVNRGHQVRLHRLGAEASSDEVILELPAEPEVIFNPEVTEDGRWLVISGERGTDPTNRLWIAELASGGRPVSAGDVRPLIATAQAHWSLVASVGEQGRELLLLTDFDAPEGRVVRIDPARDAGDIGPVGVLDVINPATVINPAAVTDTAAEPA
jgi:prolyl oligopeptidase